MPRSFGYTLRFLASVPEVIHISSFCQNLSNLVLNVLVVPAYTIQANCPCIHREPGNSSHGQLVTPAGFGELFLGAT